MSHFEQVQARWKKVSDTYPKVQGPWSDEDRAQLELICDEVRSNAKEAFHDLCFLISEIESLYRNQERARLAYRSGWRDAKKAVLEVLRK